MNSSRTRSQEKVLQLLQSMEKGISAQEIYVELRTRNQTVGLATIYRALEALKLEGVVQIRTLATGESLYSSLREDRHHLTCLHCGKSIDIEECPIEQLETKLQQQHQFKIYYHTLEFFGLCANCENKSSPRVTHVHHH